MKTTYRSAAAQLGSTLHRFDAKQSGFEDR
jgi:hypothetical protein